MSVAVCHDAWAQIACMYDTTSGEAFGPVFTGPAAGEGAEEFLKWLAENGPELPQHIDDLTTGGLKGTGADPRNWFSDELHRIVQHFQDTVLDEINDPTKIADQEEREYRASLREPDGQRMEGGRTVPTDR